MRSHFKDTRGILLVFDLTDKQTFNNCQYWLEELEQHCNTEPIILLVGNKLDMITENDENREVDYEEAQNYASKHEMMYIETSALTHKNINTAYLKLIEAVYKRFKGDKTETSFNLNNISKNGEKKSCC